MALSINNSNRAYSAAHFGLVFDDSLGKVGLFRSVEGGGIKADVMTYQQGATYERWRQLGKPKFEDLKVQVGAAMAAPFYEWMRSFFTGVIVRKSGAIMAADFSYRERARRTFSEAMITEVTFPKLDANDKGPVYFNVGIAVEDMKYVPGDMSVLAVPDGGGENKQKSWTASNFEFVLDGFGSACDRVTKVDSFTIKQTPIEYHAGNRRSPIKMPSPVDFPQLTFYVPEVDAGLFADHFEKRAINGEVPGRLTGHIEIKDNKLNPLFRVQFFGADLVSFTPDKADASTDEIKMVKIEMYTESMAFEFLG